MQSTNIVDLADKSFNEGNFGEAFDLYNVIYLDSNISSQDRAEAANMMGVMLMYDPSLDTEDESGLTYYKKALLLDPENLSALLNVINSFGTVVNSHTDLDFVNFAFAQLEVLNYKISDSENEMFQKRLRDFHDTTDV